jgi:predicted RNA polymerase sigma factor
MIDQAEALLRRASVMNAILDLYDALLAMTASPVAAFNRAIAETSGAKAGLAVVSGPQ